MWILRVSPPWLLWGLTEVISTSYSMGTWHIVSAILYYFFFSHLCRVNHTLGALYLVLLIFTTAMNNGYCDPRTTSEAIRATRRLSNLFKTTQLVNGRSETQNKGWLISEANFPVLLQSKETTDHKREVLSANNFGEFFFSMTYGWLFQKIIRILSGFREASTLAHVLLTYSCLGCQNTGPTTEPACSAQLGPAAVRPSQRVAKVCSGLLHREWTDASLGQAQAHCSN